MPQSFLIITSGIVLYFSLSASAVSEDKKHQKKKEKSKTSFQSSKSSEKLDSSSKEKHSQSEVTWH